MARKYVEKNVTKMSRQSCPISHDFDEPHTGVLQFVNFVKLNLIFPGCSYTDD